MSLYQDVDVYATLLKGDEAVEFELRRGRRVWIQIAQGAVQANGQRLDEGDGLAIDEPGVVRLDRVQAAEALLFDLTDHWPAA